MSRPASETEITTKAVYGAVAIATLVGLILRAWNLGRLGLVHFDEGIYASAATWSLDPRGLTGLDPQLVPYAPPGYPILVGLLNALLGEADVAAILVSILAGAAAIPVAAWLGSRMAGPAGAMAATVLVALHGPHVAFSRMALTDATLLLAWLLAMAAGVRLLERPGLLRGIVLGLVVGGAWLVKYNGWLAGVIVGGCALVDLAAGRVRAGDRWRLAIGVGVGAIVAGLVYLPWYLYVERHGGYAALTRHHAGYVRGPAFWLADFQAQMQQASALGGSTGGVPWAAIAAGIATGLGLGWVLSRESGRKGVVIAAASALGVAAMAVVVPNVGFWVALGAVTAAVRSQVPAVRLLGLSWIVLVALTPLYHPYARLWLPVGVTSVLMSAWEGLALARELSTRERTVWFRSCSRAVRVGLGILIAGLVIEATGLGPSAGVRPAAGLLGPSDSVRQAVAEMAASPEGRGGPGAPVAVYGRPAVLYYLAGAGASTGRLPSLEAAEGAVAAGGRVLIDPALLGPLPFGDEAQSERVAVEALDRAGVRVTPARQFDTMLNLPTWLDLDPANASRTSGPIHVPLILLGAGR